MRRPAATAQVFRDLTIEDNDNWRVIYNDRICSPNFNSKGAAYAYLELLQKGYRRPEYATPTED